MRAFLAQLFRPRPTPQLLESRQDALQRDFEALRGDFLGWELRMTELTGRLANQLRRMSQVERAAQRRQEREDAETDGSDDESAITEALRRAGLTP